MAEPLDVLRALNLAHAETWDRLREAEAQLLLLQDALASLGVSEEEIAAVLAGKGLSR
jgi:uncharacterized protein YjiS (DUF1127 family)